MKYQSIQDKFKSVIVDKCNNNLKSIKVCKEIVAIAESVNARTPNAYEYCKLLNVNDDDLDENNFVNLNGQYLIVMYQSVQKLVLV